MAPTTTAATTTTPINPANLTAAQWRSEVFRLTNVERANAGLPIFKMGTSALLAAADTRADEIVINFSHVRPDGTSCFTVLAEFGVAYSSAGENIIKVTANAYTPAQIVQKWMDSSGHRANILNPNFTMLGIGYVRANGSDYFVQSFIKPR